MGKQKFTNNATAFITSNISPTSLSFTVESAFADRFPSLSSGDWFAGTLQNAAGDIEIIRVNKRDVGSNAMQNVVRAQEGTTALSFSAGETVFSVRATAAHHQEQVDHITSMAGAHAASAIAFTPTLNVDATDAQAAIEETFTNLVTAISMATAILASGKVGVADLVKQTYTNQVTAGTVPDFTIAPTPAVDAYVAGLRFQLIPHAVSAAAANTLNLSGLGAKAVKAYTPAGTKVDATFAAGQALDVMYDGTDWVVFNVPATGEPVGDVRISFTPTPAPGLRRLLVQGQAVSLTSYPTLLALWCGATLNSNSDPTQQADFFYRCVDAANPTTTRSNVGEYLVLPPAAYFLRPLNLGNTGADVGRKRFKLQEDDFKAHTHEQAAAPVYGSNGFEGPNAAGRGPTQTGSAGGSETRPKNFGVYVWLCY